METTQLRPAPDREPCPVELASKSRPWRTSQNESRPSGGRRWTTLLANVWKWHIASFRCDAEFGRYRDIADIAIKLE